MICVVSSHDEASASPTHSARDASPRLGYLLKHAALRYLTLTTAALQPLGIHPNEWAALNCLHEQHGLSQREAAELLGIDRTKMVALVDELERKGWVQRQPQPGDRRKNLVMLTESGHDILDRAGRVIDDCERQFLAVLSRPDSERLMRSLRAITEAE